MTTDLCALCDYELAKYPIRDGDRAFCCPGCYTVYNILQTSDQLANYQETPIFKQAVRSGLISNPKLLEQIRQSKPQDIPENEFQKLHLEVFEMWCPACAEIIRLILLQEKGIRQCIVDYATDLASVEYCPRYISKEKIFELVNSLGYRAESLDSLKKPISLSLYLRFAIAAFCALNVMMFAYPIYATYFDGDDQGYGMLFAWLSCFVSLPVITYCAWPIVKRFWSSLKTGLFGMETLVVLGIATAFGLSLYNLSKNSSKVYFDSMSVIIAFVLLGKIIETKAKFSAKDSIIRLARSIPRRGRKRFSDGSEKIVPVKEINYDDIIKILTGERIVLDGVVVEGNGACDESIMTGESIPVPKQAGSKVLAGSILQSGTIACRVIATQEESILSKIIEIVQQEVGRKTAYVRAADVIVRWFVPMTILIAFATGLSTFVLGVKDPGKTEIETALIRAVSVLLISCPCAIGIAAPIAESHVLNGIAGLGAIVRNRGCLPMIGRETVFIFDKTGTVTEGNFKVWDGLKGLSPNQRSILKGLSSQSTHPIATSITQSILEDSVTIEHVEEHAGSGVCGYFEGQIVHLGSAEFLRRNGIVCDFFSMPQGVFSTVYFAMSGKVVSHIILGDGIKKGIEELMKEMSLSRKILLSGDSSAAVEAVSKICRFDDWQSGCNPMQKRAYIEELRRQGHVVCMLGDGINDAPALAAANIGISVVNATDISIQVSDILLTTDRLNVIPKIQTLARLGQRIIKQNLFWAFLYNTIGIVLAVFGALSPLFAAFAMIASSLAVVINAQRLAKWE